MLLSTDQHVQVNIGATQTGNNSSKKLLGVATDGKLKRCKTKKYLEQIYAKTRAKSKALARIAPFMNIQKNKVLTKAFLRLNLATTY